MAIDERTFGVHGEHAEIADSETGVEYEHNDAPDFDFDVEGFLAAKKEEEEYKREQREEEAKIAARSLRNYRLKQDGGLK